MTNLAATSSQPATMSAPAPADRDEPVAMGWRVAGAAWEVPADSKDYNCHRIFGAWPYPRSGPGEYAAIPENECHEFVETLCRNDEEVALFRNAVSFKPIAFLRSW